MNTKSKSTVSIGAVIAAICIVIYLFALTQATVRLYLSIDQRRIDAEQQFSRISTLALSAGMQGFMNDRFIETMNNAFAVCDAIEAMIITGPEGEYVFERQQGYAVKWINNSPRFTNRFGLSGQNYYKPLPINEIRNANIKSIARVFDYTEMLKILKETLLLILIGFAIAFFTMLLQLLTGKSSETFVEIAGKKARAAYPPAPERFAAKEPPPPQPQYTPKEAAREAPVTHDYPIVPEPGPKGLYSPRSNIGWEEYTKDRLDSELHRCSSTENDLTLVLMEFTDLTNDIMFRQAAEEAVSFFSSRDMLFEYGKQGILVILPCVDLYTGISKSEKFYRLVMEKFPGGGKSASSLCIGLSSRSDRLLNADRMMLEVQEALQKAKRDRKSPIIAFKSDPEKYRAFISRQTE